MTHTMHLGATLRLLRVDAGVSLRDLARRIGVSNAYLSRVENGRDAAPTIERLEAIARELDIPVSLLADMGYRVSPFVASYIDEVPEARALFLEIARRRLTPAQIHRVRAFIADEIPCRAADSESRSVGLAKLVSPEHVVLDLACSSVDDLVDVAASRLAKSAKLPARDLAELLRRSEEDAPGAIGGGLHLSRALVPGIEMLASIVVLARPLHVQTPDDVPLRVGVVILASRRGKDRLVELAHVVRLGARGLADELSKATRPSEVIATLLELERFR